MVSEDPWIWFYKYLPVVLDVARVIDEVLGIKEATAVLEEVPKVLEMVPQVLQMVQFICLFTGVCS